MNLIPLGKDTSRDLNRYLHEASLKGELHHKVDINVTSASIDCAKTSDLRDLVHVQKAALLLRLCWF